MNAPWGRYRQTILVTAMAAFAIAFAPSTIAQDLPAVQWWHGLQPPDDETRESLLENVQTTSASVFDPTLPAISLERWLWSTLTPVVEVVYPQLVEWDVTFCLDPRSAIVDVGSQLCATGAVRLSADRNVQIVFLIADGVPGVTGGPPQWRPTRPSLRDVYIERVKDRWTRFDSLDVPSLGALSQMLNTPFEQWPTVDFETTVSWDPPNPAPGDMVRFSISVRNTSERSVDRARVEIVISPCCAIAEVRQEWFPRIAAGQSVRVEGKVLLPKGMASALVIVNPWRRDKVVRESHPDKDHDWVHVGYPLPAR